MKIQTLLSFFLFINIYSFAGIAGEGISTIKELKIEKKVALDLMLELNRIRQSNISADKKIDAYNKLIKKAIETDNNAVLGLAYYELGLNYQSLQQNSVAIQFFLLASENASGAVPYDVFYALGTSYAQIGEYKLSNQYLNQYLKGKEELKLALKAELAIANNLLALENYTRAIEIYEVLLTEFQKNKNEIGVIECYSRLAVCYISIGEIDKGISFYNASLKRGGVQEDNLTTKKKESKEIVSKALRKTRNYAEEISVINSDFSGEALGGLEQLRLAESYFELQKMDQSVVALDAYLKDPSYNLIDKSEIEIIRKIALAFQSQNNPDRAAFYFSKYIALEDTIQNRIAELERKNKSVNGYQNILQLEILRKDKEIAQNTIQHLVEADELKEDVLSSQRTTIGLLIGLLLLVLIGVFFILRVSKQRRIANQQLALRSLRSQMNPHFIFNALNSVNSFISENDERTANRFLSEFSRLMRLVMEHSEHNFITLSKELEIIRIYLELEHFRFSNQFEYQLIVDDSIDEEVLQIPPMLIQPYIENAIWHGLRYKEGKGMLKVQFAMERHHLLVVIEDDGIGRKRSAEIKTENQKKNKSTALRNISERIRIFNDLHQLKIEVEISDVMEDGSGTKVRLVIPQQKNK